LDKISLKICDIVRNGISFLAFKILSGVKDINRRFAEENNKVLRGHGFKIDEKKLGKWKG
jgi:hypothetical protein